MSKGASRGFTLIEMLVTVTIVGLISTIAFPMLELVQRRNSESELRSALRQIRTAIDSYKQAVDEGRIVEENKGSGYPPSLDVLVNGVPDVKSANKGRMIYFLRKIPKDATSKDPLDAPARWGLRSYASPANAPQAGADVFDVYSLTPGVGLSGVPYKDW